MKIELTGRQQEVLRVIKLYLNENGYAPSVRNVADMMGISTKGAFDHIDALVKKGWIKKDENISRSIRIIE